MTGKFYIKNSATVAINEITIFAMRNKAYTTNNKCKQMQKTNKPVVCLDSCMPNKHTLQASTYSVLHLRHTLNARGCTSHPTPHNNNAIILFTLRFLRTTAYML